MVSIPVRISELHCRHVADPAAIMMWLVLLGFLLSLTSAAFTAPPDAPASDCATLRARLLSATVENMAMKAELAVLNRELVLSREKLRALTSIEQQIGRNPSREAPL